MIVWQNAFTHRRRQEREVVPFNQVQDFSLRTVVRRTFADDHQGFLCFVQQPRSLSDELGIGQNLWRGWARFAGPGFGTKYLKYRTQQHNTLRNNVCPRFCFPYFGK